MKEPKISVVVPVYNAAKYLPCCLKSLLLQTYGNIEIIAIDDCSTDNSLSILEEFANKDKRIKIIKQTHNQGQAVARNVGLKNVSGEYVSFIDSDDWISLCLYEKFVKDIQNTPQDIDIYYFNGFLFYEKTIMDKGIFPIFDIHFWRGYLDKKIFSFKDNTNPMVGTISACSKIFKKEYLEKFGFKFLENKIFEDALFSMQTFLNTDNIYVKNEYMYNYRQHGTSTVHTMGENAFDLFVIHEEIEKLFKEHDFYEKSKYALFQSRFGGYFSYLFKIKPEFQESFLQKAKQVLLEKVATLDEKIYRRLKDIQKFDELTTQSLQYLNLKYGREN